MGESVVCIIPARGGSKGVPRKNLKPLGGVPLINWAIKTSLNSKTIDKTIVTTDDAEIASVAENEGADVLLRPSYLAQDTSPTIDTLQFALRQLEEMGSQFETLVLLEPTSPFRDSELVDQCVTKFHAKKSEGSVLTVTQLERNPNNIFSVDGDLATPYIQKPKKMFVQRQQFSFLKRINGCVYVTQTQTIFAGRLVKDPIHVVEMLPRHSVNIDTIEDFELAEIIARDFPSNHC